MKGEKTFLLEYRNLVKFADNLPLSYFKAPQKQQRFDEKRVKSATKWKFIIQNTPSCLTSRLYEEQLMWLLAKRDNIPIFEIFKKSFWTFFVNLTSISIAGNTSSLDTGLWLLRHENTQSYPPKSSLLTKGVRNCDFSNLEYEMVWSHAQRLPNYIM